TDGEHRLNAALCRRCGACAEDCYAGALEMVGREITLPEALADVEADRPFYERSGGGVTVSGGEPLLQADFAVAFLGACRARGLHTALDTSGYAPWPVLAKVAAEADLVLYDVKHTNSDRHRDLTGVPNERILANLRRLLASGAKVAVRLPIVPGCNDEDDHFRALGAFLGTCAAPPVAVDLLPYHGLGQAKHRRLGRPYPLAACQPPTSERLEAIRDLLVGWGLNVRLPD
ncbi:MAG: glycyl-radical enzyme activating protein, partial [Chloroflexota bacterium]